MKLAEVFTMVVPEERGVGFKAFDGSVAGPPDASVVLDIRTPRAVEYLAGAPSQLGLARAYVAGDLEIVGDPFDAMMRLYPAAKPHLGFGEWLRLLGSFLPAALKRPTPAPATQRVVMPKLSTITTTSRTASTAWCWARRWPTPARSSQTLTPRSRPLRKRSSISSVESLAFSQA